jgi:hypothetical protein
MTVASADDTAASCRTVRPADDIGAAAREAAGIAAAHDIRSWRCQTAAGAATVRNRAGSAPGRGDDIRRRRCQGGEV